MILSTIVRAATQGRRDVGRYAAWAAALRRLNDDWVGGNRPTVQALAIYLNNIAEDQQCEAMEDIVATHLRRTWQVGPGLLVNDYASAFATLLRDMPVDLVETEWLARYQMPWGDAPSIESYVRRFPGRRDIVQRLERCCFADQRYVALRRIGRGAMAEVWQAYDRHLSRSVALKRSRSVDGLTKADGDDAVVRLAQEARLTARLDHPGIVTVCDLHESEPRGAFIVMRLVEGPTLAQLIHGHHHPTQALDRAARAESRQALLDSFLTVCDAMAHAHSRGILHRDLKPGNVIVQSPGQAVVLDWGLACERRAASDTAGHAADVIGTPQYMAPEQVVGVTDVGSEVFNLGAMLYELLTGRPPHDWGDAGLPVDWTLAAREGRITSPRQANARIGRALAGICAKALSRRPEDRHADAAALADDLRGLRRGRTGTW